MYFFFAPALIGILAMLILSIAPLFRFTDELIQRIDPDWDKETVVDDAVEVQA